MNYKLIIENTRRKLTEAIAQVVVDHQNCIGTFYKNVGIDYIKSKIDEEYDSTPIIAVIHDPQITAYGSMEAATVYDIYCKDGGKIFLTLNGESGEDFNVPIEHVAIDSLLNIVTWLQENNFIKSKKKQAMTIMHEFWDFIEKYLPNYYHRDDVLRQSDLQLLIDGQESPLTGKIDIDEAEDELHHLLYNIYIEAIDAYTKGSGNECQECESTNHFSYCPICGKKHP